MSKTKTQYNRSHPKIIFNDSIKDTKRLLSSLSNQELTAMVERFKVDPKSNRRKHLIDALIEEEKQMFKENWKEKYGWDLEEAFDPDKWAERMKKLQKAEKGNSEE